MKPRLFRVTMLPVVGLLVAGLLAGCQSTGADGESAPVAVVEAPLLGELAVVKRSGLLLADATFPVAAHHVAMTLPTGYCVIGDRGPTQVVDQLSGLSDHGFQVDVVAMACPIASGRVTLSLPMSIAFAGRVLRDGTPIIMNEADRRQYKVIRDALQPGGGDAAIREVFLESFVKGAETSGTRVEHIEARAVGETVQASVLMLVAGEGVSSRSETWVFIDMTIGEIADRLVGLGLMSIGQEPTPPNASHDSVALYNGLRQVRND